MVPAEWYHWQCRVLEFGLVIVYNFVSCSAAAYAHTVLQFKPTIHTNLMSALKCNCTPAAQRQRANREVEVVVLPRPCGCGVYDSFKTRANANIRVLPEDTDPGQFVADQWLSSRLPTCAVEEGQTLCIIVMGASNSGKSRAVCGDGFRIRGIMQQSVDCLSRIGQNVSLGSIEVMR